MEVLISGLRGYFLTNFSVIPGVERTFLGNKICYLRIIKLNNMAPLRLFPLLIVAGLFLFSTPALSSDSWGGAPSISQQSQKKIEILFTPKMKRADLMKLKSSLLKKNIQLDITEARYNASGFLTYLDFYVDCRDGFKGGAGTNISTNTRRFGFYRDYTKDADSPFGVGFI